MLSINLYDLAKYSLDEINNLLVNSNQDCFEISWPRLEFQQGDETDYLLFEEYKEAIYCGELLSGLGTQFACNIPLANCSMPFHFRIETRDIQKLSETLFHLASAAAEFNDLSRWEYYEIEKDNFILNSWNEHTEPFCTGLLPVTRQTLDNTIKLSEKRHLDTSIIHTIRLSEFKDYGQKEIQEYLQLTDSLNFCIILGRFQGQISYDSFQIANEYYHAAFVGQKLYEVSNCFSYLVPAEYSSFEFEFYFQATNLRSLARTIFQLGKMYDHSPESVKKYRNQLDRFGIAYSKGRLDPVCQGLVDIFEQAAERAENQ